MTPARPASWLPVPAFDSCAPRSDSVARDPVTVEVPVDLVNALASALHAGGAFDVTLPAGVVPRARGPVRLHLLLPPLLDPCGDPDGGLLLQIAGAEVTAMVGAGLLAVPIHTTLAFDIRLPLDGAGPAELVRGSVVTADRMMERLGVAIGARVADALDLGPRVIERDGVRVEVRRLSRSRSRLVLAGAIGPAAE